MQGFTEIYPFVQDVELTDGQRIKVCSMEGIIMLKLLANDDRPQRTKDISDIEHIIQSYFDLYGGDIYEHHFDVMEMYDNDGHVYPISLRQGDRPQNAPDAQELSKASRADIQDIDKTANTEMVGNA